MGAVHNVRIDPDKCICHEWCIHLCPEVFELSQEHAIARVKDGAAAFFQTHSTQIVQAVRECPVGAIEAAVDHDPPPAR
jgi:ferredoxin